MKGDFNEDITYYSCFFCMCILYCSRCNKCSGAHSGARVVAPYQGGGSTEFTQGGNATVPNQGGGSFTRGGRGIAPYQGGGSTRFARGGNATVPNQGGGSTGFTRGGNAAQPYQGGGSTAPAQHRLLRGPARG